VGNDVSRAVAEAVRRKEQEIRWRPREFLFEKQLEVFDCRDPYVCKRVGRRGGKSYEAAADLVDAGFAWPGSTPLYVTTTRQDARDIMDPAFALIDKKFGLGLKQNKATGDITLPNDSRIMMRGAATLREINKLRGPAYPVVKIDEVQNFGPDLHYLIDEVLEPATAQFHKGKKPASIAVSGTPPPAQYGPFWDIDQGKFAESWTHFHWTFLDNPTIPAPEEFLARVLKRRGWTEDHPGYQREYLGLWVRDDQARAFDFDPQRDAVDTFDTSHALDWNYVMGIDIGYNDPCAYVVIAQARSLGQAYVIDSFEQSEMGSMEALVEAERFCEKYPISRIAIDAGGGGAKMIQKDWEKLTRLPVEAAKKTHKASQVSTINGDFRAGKLKIARDNNLKLINDLMVLEWDGKKKENNKFVYPRGAPDHLPDALQYAYNLCFHHTHDFQYDNSVKFGSPEYWQREDDEMEKGQVENVGSDDSDPWKHLEESYMEIM
jgi:hypothetical protein